MFSEIDSFSFFLSIKKKLQINHSYLYHKLLRDYNDIFQSYGSIIASESTFICIKWFRDSLTHWIESLNLHWRLFNLVIGKLY